MVLINYCYILYGLLCNVTSQLLKVLLTYSEHSYYTTPEKSNNYI